MRVTCGHYHRRPCRGCSRSSSRASSLPSPAAAGTTRSRPRRPRPRPPRRPRRRPRRRRPRTPAGSRGQAASRREGRRPRTAEFARPKQQLEPGKTYVATVTTNCGEFEITLDAKRAPKTGGSFKFLADKGFFDGLGFHRIVSGFVIQGGDPKGDGSGGPGYSIVEAAARDPHLRQGRRGDGQDGDRGPGHVRQPVLHRHRARARRCRRSTRCSARSRRARRSST